MQTFTVHSFKTKISYKLNVEGEIIESIEALAVGQEPILHATLGEDVPIENTVFRIGAPWRYIGSNDIAVRGVIFEMMEAIKTPQFAFI